MPGVIGWRGKVLWEDKERSEEFGASELAGARRLLEAVKSMASFVERARDTERQMRSDWGGLEQRLDEAERFGALERSACSRM
jgi:hypothetical protein